MSTDRLLSGDEAASFLGMSRAWLYRSAVPFVKLGRRRLYRTADLRAFVSGRLKSR